MTGSKVLSTLWNVFFDTHVWVSKPDEADLVALFGGHSELLASI
jgi:hypothetical protein